MRLRPLLVLVSLIIPLVFLSCATSADVSTEGTEITSEQPVIAEKPVETVTEDTTASSEIASTSVPPKTEEEQSVLPITWETTAEQFKGMYGEKKTLLLPPDGYPMPYDGYGSYDFDSSIGSAAVAMGLITFEQGGEVTILIKEGVEYVKGGETYEGWNTIFSFVDADGQEISPVIDSLIIVSEEEIPAAVYEQALPEFFTVYNQTDTNITYIDIFTNDMMAVDEYGINLLHGDTLAPGASLQVLFEYHKDLKETILFRYGQMLHVVAENDKKQLYYREWYPDFETLDLVLAEDHLNVQRIEEPLAEDTIRIINMTDYEIIDLYILTAEMEEQLNFDTNVLGAVTLLGGEYIDIHKNTWPYLQEFFSIESQDHLIITAFDEDDFMLVRDWNPHEDPWAIELTDADYVL